jgi:trk system potassium uptake protein TrkH
MVTTAPQTVDARARWRRLDRARAASRAAVALYLLFEFALEAGAQPGPVFRWTFAGLAGGAALWELARDAWAFRGRILRHRWPDLLLAAPSVALFAGQSPRSAAAFLVLRLAVRELLDAAYSRPVRPVIEALLRRPIALLCLSFGLTIAAGTLALLPPAASAPGRVTGPATALFVATSATCVTGLSVVDVGSHFSRFGHWVILALVQVGGLGIMTITTALALVFRARLSARMRGAMQAIAEEETVTGFSGLVASIAAITLAVETAGALALYPSLTHGAGGLPLAPADRAFHAAFHAVNAFCNAGFSLYPDSLARFAGDLAVNATVVALIVLGGIGFPVMTTLLRVDRWWRHGLVGGWAFVPVHARIVLVSSAALLAGGAVAFLVLEWGHSLAPLSVGDRLVASVFQSATLRTAGFSTVDLSAMGTPMLLLSLALMFVGGSPGGTAGGVKTTTVAVLVLTFWAMLRNRTDVEVFGRRVPAPNVYRAAAVAVVSLAMLFVLAFVLFAVEPDLPFRSLLFEAVSAFGTVGLTVGATPSLGIAGQLTVCALMFVGRLGPFTLAVAAGLSKERAAYELPATKIVVG